MIIFGWGFQTIKNFGPTFRRLCDHCHNEKYWVLSRTMTWFTLFFIPVFPYEIKHRLFCPICEYGLTLDKKQIDEIKPLAEMNQLLIDGKITQEEYQARINQFNSGSPETVPAEAIEVKVLPEGNNMALSYCSNCGTHITKELKFCGNCGTAVAHK